MAEERKAPSAASAKALDFTNVKDGGGIFNKKRQPAGDYAAKVTKVVEVESKKDGKAQWLFTIQAGAGTYPFYCKLVPEQLWKLRNLLMAAGLNVPKQRLKVDPNKLVGRKIAITLDDDEYDDGDKIHHQSNITATFPLAELDPDASRDTEDEEDEEEDEDEDDTPPPAKKKKAPPVEEEDDEEEDEDDEEEEPAPPPKKSKKKKAPEPEEDEDDDELDELEIDL